MTTPYLVGDIERDEGCRLTAYLDTRGIWTIGVGHAHVDPGTVWTQAQADNQLALDIQAVCHQLDDALPWWRTLNDARQDVMVNIGFNLGVAKLASWHHTLGDIQNDRFTVAGVDLRNDEPWASQVHARALRLATQMETGVRA